MLDWRRALRRGAVSRGVEAWVKLQTVDLNLLVVLQALLDERSVTRAGARLGLSQPATSHALARLRDMLDDPVLVRSGRAMVPTPRAEAIRGPLAKLLDDAQELVVQGRRFEPGESTTEFRIAADDYASVTRMPDVIAAVARGAPKARIRALSMGLRAMIQGLTDGRLDVGLLMGEPARLPEPLEYVKLWRDEFVCVVRGDHPCIGDSMTLDEYCSVPHMLISPGGDFHGVVDEVLAEQGRSRTVGLIVPRFDLAPEIVSRTDFLLNMNARYARTVGEMFGLRMFAPPLELPRGTLCMVWHPRTAHDAGRVWLRERIAG